MVLHSNPFDLDRRQTSGAGGKPAGIAVAAEVDQDVDIQITREFTEGGIVQSIRCVPRGRDRPEAQRDGVRRGIVPQADQFEPLRIQCFQPGDGEPADRVGSQTAGQQADAQPAIRFRRVGEARVWRARQQGGALGECFQQCRPADRFMIRQGVAQRPPGKMRVGSEGNGLAGDRHGRALQAERDRHVGEVAQGGHVGSVSGDQGIERVLRLRVAVQTHEDRGVVIL